MSEGPKKNPDNLNTLGIVTVGLVGSALVYLSIVGLQAFYVDETAIVDEVRSFGDQEKIRVSLKAEQMGRITSDLTRKGVAADGKPIVAIPIDAAKALIVRDAKVDAANLVPIVGRSEASTIQPIFGRPVALPPPPPADVPPPADGTVPGVVPPDGTTPGTAPGSTQPGVVTPGTAPAGTPPGAATPPTGTTPSQPNPGTGTPNAPAGTPQPGQIPAPATPSTQPRSGVPAPAVQPPAARPGAVPGTGAGTGTGTGTGATGAGGR